MDTEPPSTKKPTRNSDGEVQRRAISDIYMSLSQATTAQYWQQLNADDLPLEVLVRCCRDALARGDQHARERIIEIIVRRTHRSNEQWASFLVLKLAIPYDVRAALMDDLYADLYERIIRGILDERRPVWEESFWSCLKYERQHSWEALLKREGLIRAARTKISERIPRHQLSRIQSWNVCNNEGAVTLELEDEYEQKLQLEIEYTDLFQQVLLLPTHLRAVVLLIFWEGLTERQAASLLRVTDRTVRNRMHEASKLLYEKLTLEPGGASNDG